MRFSLLAPFTMALIASPAQANDSLWGLSIGGGAAVAPTYAGDDDYVVNALPFVRVSYDDIFAMSVPEGATIKLYDQDGFSARAVAKLAFDRDEDGSAPFRVIGERTTDLIGLGDVAATVELGGRLDYAVDNWTLSGALRQGVGGHDGLLGEISARYSTSIRGYGPPIRIGIGPSLSFGDATFTNAYYGVTAAQSAASGLSEFDAGGGLYAYGLSLSATAPLTDRSAIFLQGSLSQLTGDTKYAPLVAERGSATQAFGGVFWVYTFGQDARRGRRR